MTKHIFNDIETFVYIKYFWVFLCLDFVDIRNIEGSDKARVEDIRGVKDTKVGKLLRKKFVDKTFWYFLYFYQSFYQFQ